MSRGYSIIISKFHAIYKAASQRHSNVTFDIFKTLHVHIDSQSLIKLIHYRYNVVNKTAFVSHSIRYVIRSLKQTTLSINF